MNDALRRQDENRVFTVMSNSMCLWCRSITHGAQDCKWIRHNKQIRKCRYQFFDNTVPHGMRYCQKLITTARRVVKGQDSRYAVDVLKCVQQFDDEAYAEWITESPDIPAFTVAAGVLPKTCEIKWS